MRVQNVQNTNFGAIKIKPTVPNGYSDLVGAGKAYAQKSINEQMKNLDAILFIQQIAKKLNAKIEPGLDNGLESFNVMSKKGSLAEKQAIKDLSQHFKTKKIRFDIESVTMAQAKASAKNFFA